MSNGNNYTILVGDPLKDKEETYLKREDQPIIYAISNYTLSAIFKKRDDLVEKNDEDQVPPPELQPHGVRP